MAKASHASFFLVFIKVACQKWKRLFHILSDIDNWACQREKPNILTCKHKQQATPITRVLVPTTYLLPTWYLPAPSVKYFSNRWLSPCYCQLTLHHLSFWRTHLFLFKIYITGPWKVFLYLWGFFCLNMQCTLDSSVLITHTLNFFKIPLRMNFCLDDNILLVSY